MYISKPLRWVVPYLDKLRKNLPNIRMPKSIKTYTHSKSPKYGAMGVCTKYTKSISIAVSFHRAGHVGLFRLTGELDQTAVLDTLAHEIAHLHVWDHGPAHTGLTRAIFEAFEVGQQCPVCLGAGKVCNLKK